MKKLLVVAVLTILLGLSFSSTGINIEKKSTFPYQGTILYVGGSGVGNYTSIQNAINDAQNEDTIFVYDYSSPYDENIIINKTITLIGENKETTLINGFEEKDVVRIISEYVYITGFSIQTTGLDSYNMGIKIEANHTKIFGNIILNNNFGIYIVRSSFSEIINNTFINNENGLRINTDNNIIKNNSFFNDGISIGYCKNIVEDNTANHKPILHLMDASDKIIENDLGQIILINCSNITIKNQRIAKTSTGISLYNCNNCNLTNNAILESKSGIIIANSNYNNLSYNSLYQNKNLGIGIYSSCFNKIQYNWCTEHLMGKYVCNGVLVSSGSFNTISRNVIRQNGVGLGISQSYDNIISENIIEFNTYIGVKINYNSENNSINKNVIRHNDRGVVLDEVSYNIITNNNFIDNDEDLDLHIVQYFKLRLNRLPRIRNNYWNRFRLLPKCNLGEFTFVYMDVPYGGYIHLNWLYIDRNPAKKPNEI